MVSPLKTWKHPESERLWPILGGLSVLAHIGLLGFSLPYLFELMQPSSSAESATTIPIELIIESPQNSEAAALTKARPADAQPANRTTTQSSNTQPANTQPSEINPIQPDISSVQSNPASGFEEIAPTPVQRSPSSTTRPPEPTSPATEPEPPENQNSDRPSGAPSNSTEEGTGNGSDTEPTDNISDSTPQNPDRQTDRPTDVQTDQSRFPTAASEPTVIPTIASTEALPTPDESIQAAEGARSPQSAALSIVDFREVDGIQRDVGKTPPKPKEGNVSNAVVLDPSSAGCGRLEFSQQQWVYRVAVREDGTIQTATPWTGGIGRPLSEEERAIACLIESAGFEFEPALFEGQPILDDNLLLTISLIEMPQQDAPGR